MLNIFKKKQKNFNDKSLNTNYINKENNNIIHSKLDRDEYKNIIFYPNSTKEWFNSVYSYNKSYTKSLITTDVVLNNLFKTYFNMLKDKIKILFKRRRHNKSRYSANKIYLSRAELKHTNTKLLILLYTYNKQKSSIQRYVRKLVKRTIIKKISVKDEIENMVTRINRLIPVLKDKFFNFKKWKMVFLKKIDSLLIYLIVHLKKRPLNLYKIPRYNMSYLKRVFKLQQIIFNSTKLSNFNKSKFNNLFLNLSDLGLISFIEKIYAKRAEIKLVELKSIHLNSDVFSSAVALKLRDRKNKAVRVLRRAIFQMVKIPDLHTLITFDDNTEKINKNNLLNFIKQQVVRGVRFEASGRLTRRLTAMRAIFKYRYVGGLRDVRSSLNNKSSTMIRGFVKSNSQYTLLNSKTRNGTFGLKTWVSSHSFTFFVPVLNGIDYSVSTLIYLFDFCIISCDGPNIWINYLPDSYNRFITYFAVCVGVWLFCLIVRYFDYIKVCLANLGSKLSLSGFLLLIRICRNPMLILYTYYGVYYCIILFNILHHSYILLPSIGDLSLNYLYIYTHLMGIDYIEFETAANPGSNVYLATSGGSDGNYGIEYNKCTTSYGSNSQSSNIPLKHIQPVVVEGVWNEKILVSQDLNKGGIYIVRGCDLEGPDKFEHLSQVYKTIASDKDTPYSGKRFTTIHWYNPAHRDIAWEMHKELANCNEEHPLIWNNEQWRVNINNKIAKAFLEMSKK